MNEEVSEANDAPQDRGAKSAAAFRTISEVARDLGLPQHVLRFWETKFEQIQPLKRGGGRRYYRPEDVTLLRRVRDLLHREGYTIKGVQKLFAEEARPRREVGDLFESVQPKRPDAEMVLDAKKRAELEAVLDELSDLRNLLRKPLQ